MTEHALPGPENILRRELPNGVVILARENWTAPSVVIEGYLAVGGIDDTAELMGLASYTASMLSRGTRQHAFAEINEMVEAVGAAVGLSANRHVTHFSAKSLNEDLDLILQILCEEMRQPVFPEEHVERLRGIRMTALAERENSTRQMANKTYRELLYPNHPLSFTLLGTKESNARIRRDDIVNFYETYFKPAGVVIAVVGALPAEEAARKVEAAFGDWTGERPARPPLPAITPPAQVVDGRILMPDKSQSDLIIGWPAMARLDPDYEVARVANTVLGVFGMMGRLGTNVRERQGMAYHASSQVSADRQTGQWSLLAGVNPKNVERAAESMLQEIKRLREEPVPEDELEDTRRYLTGSLPLHMETNDGVASLLVDLEWYQLGLDYVQRFRDIVYGVTAEQVQTVAQKYMHPEAYVIAVAGP